MMQNQGRQCLTLLAGGDTIAFTYVGSAAWSPNVDDLGAFAGQYRSDEIRTTWTARIEGRRLALSSRRGNKILLTPVYKDVVRPWEIGVIHDQDERLSAPLIAALQATKRFDVGVNQPYSPADRVYFTLERHARSRGLPCAMIEIRNGEIADADGQTRWAELLAQILGNIRLPASAGLANPHLDS